jgi:hypothetical protein
VERILSAAFDLYRGKHKLLSLQPQADLPGLGIIIEAGKRNDFLLQDQVYSGFSNA